MEVTDEHDFYEITFIGCFSCFLTACRLINDLIAVLFKHYNPKAVKILGKAIDLPIQDFTTILREEYNEKYQQFKAILTDKTFNASASTFYKKLRRLKFLGPFGRP